MSTARLFVIAALAGVVAAAAPVSPSAADAGPDLKTPLSRLVTGQPHVSVVSTPDDGIQPQAVVDDRGTIHVVYFKGDPAGGDVYYLRLAGIGAGADAALPVRVNTVAGSALATGTVRGAQIAIGRNGIVHVAWHGSKA